MLAAGVMLDELCKQPLQLAAICARQRRDERLLRGVDSSVEALQRTGARRRELDEHAPAVVRVAHARDQVVPFELPEQRVHVAAIDQQASPEGGLAGGSPLGEGAQHDEMLAAKTLRRERAGDESGGGLGDPTRQPAG